MNTGSVKLNKRVLIMNNASIERVLDGYDKMKKFLEENYSKEYSHEERIILATKLIETLDEETLSTYRNLKDHRSYIPYESTTRVIIEELKETMSRGTKAFKIRVSLNTGRVYKEKLFTGKKALALVTLLALKFEKTEQCMTRGFELHDIQEKGYELLRSLDEKFSEKDYGLSRRDIDNINADISDLGFNSLIRNLGSGKRIDIPTTYIKFKSDAIHAFESHTGEAVLRFSDQMNIPYEYYEK